MKAAMTRLRLALAAATALLALPSTAAAAQAPLHPLPGGFPAYAKKAAKVDAKAPVVKKVSPRRAKVGAVLVITGKNFVPGQGKNIVFFYTTKGGGTFTNAGDASKTRLKVTVPDKLAALLPANGDEARILLRIKSKRLGARTSARVSPLISIRPDDVGGDTSGGGNTGPVGCTPNFNDPASDVDSDLLPDARERELMLDACNRDTDGDGASDGYEYYSAIDLNSQALPYPFKRPYPNPLFKDQNVDYDGDGMTLWDEYSLWTKFGQGKLPLNYSDGKQSTWATPAPDPSGPLYYMDMNGDGLLTDDERDADGDGLGNWDESHGRMTPEWWVAMFDGSNGGYTKETPYTVTFAAPSMLDPDSDGDGVLDGADDQDFDGLTNAFEIERAPNWDKTYIAIGFRRVNWDGVAPHMDNAGFPPRYYSRTQPFNPCKPVWSSVCHIHYPFGYYEDDEPWMGAENAPAPGLRPGDV
jgi:hypothetical protein